jgi:hypothetical protein
MASTPATDDVVVVDPSYKWKWLEESDTYLLSLNDLPAGEAPALACNLI